VCAPKLLYSKNPASPAAADTPNFQLLSIRRAPFSPPAALWVARRAFFTSFSQSFEDARMYYNWPAEWLNASQLENSAARSSSMNFLLRARDERVEI
jgi:hypothetical protein